MFIMLKNVYNLNININYFNNYYLINDIIDIKCLLSHV